MKVSIVGWGHLFTRIGREALVATTYYGNDTPTQSMTGHFGKLSARKFRDLCHSVPERPAPAEFEGDSHRVRIDGTFVRIKSDTEKRRATDDTLWKSDL